MKLSEKLCAMIKAVIAKYPNKPFPTSEAARHYLENTRRLLAVRDSNPRLLNIHLHTLRHFKATMLYSQTKDILFVQKILGHKSILNTMRYTQLVDLKESDNFVCKVARTLDEASGLIEKGFDFVTDLEGAKLFRKRK